MTAVETSFQFDPVSSSVVKSSCVFSDWFHLSIGESSLLCISSFAMILRGADYLPPIDLLL